MAHPMSSAMHPDDASIRAQFAALRQQGRRHRDIAQTLGISEGALLAAHQSQAPGPQGGLQVAPLRADWRALFAALPALGEVMALTRNDACVHEVVGTYPPPDASGHAAGEHLTLHLDWRAIAQGFAVREPDAKGALQQSLQFFDASGVALHKVFLRAQSDGAAWSALQERFALAHAARVAWDDLRPTPAGAPPDAASEAVRRDAQSAQPVHATSVRRVLEAAARDAMPLAISVQNSGLRQTHTGRVHRIAVMGPWLNVLDPGFNLHLREDLIAQAWVHTPPGSHGLCPSLDLRDASGASIATLAGAGTPETDAARNWSALLDELTEEPQPCAP